MPGRILSFLIKAVTARGAARFIPFSGSVRSDASPADRFDCGGHATGLG
jgi:hypothetical protein